MSDQPFLTFEAGCADYNEETKQVTPRPGPGKIIVNRDSDEGLTYLSWEPRDGFSPPDDYPLFDLYALIPGDAQWAHVKQCNTGRIFVLKFQSSNKREFFWMQSKTDAADGKPGSLSTQDKAILEVFATLLSEDNMDQDSEEEEEETTPAPSDSRAAPATQLPQHNDLTALLRSMTSANPTASGSSQAVPVINLSDALPTSLLVSHINSLDDNQLKPLMDHLPDEIPKTRAELIRVIQSSQFAQGIDSFSNVLMQGGLGPIVARELEYPYVGEGVEGFLSGVRKTTPSKKKEPDSDEMDLE